MSLNVFVEFEDALRTPEPLGPIDPDDSEGLRAYLRARYYRCNVKGIALPPGWAYWADRPKIKKELESVR